MTLVAMVGAELQKIKLEFLGRTDFERGNAGFCRSLEDAEGLKTVRAGRIRLAP